MGSRKEETGMTTVSNHRNEFRNYLTEEVAA